MELLYVILIAFAVQFFLYKVNPFMSSIAGGIITTVVLIYGVFLYGTNKTVISFIGYELSNIEFMIFIFSWYMFDFARFMFEAYKKFEKKPQETASAENEQL